MQRTEHIRLMAHYNTWMNERLYAAAASLPDAELSTERGAFFGSILGTLNHLVVADRIWLGRYTFHPAGYQTLGPVNTTSVRQRSGQN